MRKMIVPLIFGLGGVCILLALGTWQLKRLAWKEGMLASISSQIEADPVPLFSQPLTEFLAITASGTITANEAHVLTSRKPDGAGFRIVSVFETSGRRVLLDRGFVPETEKNTTRLPVDVEVIANFRTVSESDRFTPPPDLTNNYHFARDVAVLAETLGAEPILLILRETSEENPTVRPWPIDIAGISNNHLNYAITWFSLAIVWAGMTAFLLWRIRRRTV